MNDTSRNHDLTSSSKSTVYTEIGYVTIDRRVLRFGRRRISEQLGPPLLIFNGIGANVEILEPFVKALEGVEIVTFDVPGAGSSPAPTLPYRYRQIARLADH